MDSYAERGILSFPASAIFHAGAPHGRELLLLEQEKEQGLAAGSRSHELAPMGRSYMEKGKEKPACAGFFLHQ